MAEDKARTMGFVGCSLALCYYSYEVYAYASHWDSWAAIKQSTQCPQLYVLELWLLTQNVLWIVAIGLLMMVLVKPEGYKLLLCFLYLMGPVYFVWSGVSAGYYWAFVACCKEKLDGCINYYPFTNYSSFTALLTISLLFSGLISLYLLVIVGAVFWRQLHRWLQSYAELLM